MFFRALVEISASEGPTDGFNLLSAGMVTMSTTLVAHDLQIKLLSDQLLVSRCQQAEETCGRVNVDNLNRLIIVGGPYLSLSENLQAKLRSQVSIVILNVFFAHLTQFIPNLIYPPPPKLQGYRQVSPFYYYLLPP